MRHIQHMGTEILMHVMDKHQISAQVHRFISFLEQKVNHRRQTQCAGTKILMCVMDKHWFVIFPKQKANAQLWYILYLFEFDDIHSGYGKKQFCMQMKFTEVHW